MPTTREVFFQSLVAFAVLFVLARLMGKRQVAQLTFFDYIVGITIGNIAAAWSMDDVRSTHAVVSLVVWTLIPLILAYIQRKSLRARMILDGQPIAIIKQGKVLEKNLGKARLEVEELMSLLREKDVFKLSEVEYALFEVNGHLTVMKKSDTMPVTVRDLKLPVTHEHEPHILIIDGKLMKKALAKSGYTEEWLRGEMMKQGASDVREVFVAQVDSNGNLYVDLYHDEQKEPQIPAKPLVHATLKKIQADLESFALQTKNPDAKAMYACLAVQLQELLIKMSPYLRG